MSEETTATLQIRNWNKFQHFKDRRPPWVKLYRDLLDDRDWHALSGDDSKMLINLFLLASEDEHKKGNIPQVVDIAFRLRTTENKVNQALTKLKKWVIQDDINVISEPGQVGPPETETETETETESAQFAEFWKSYPKRKGKDPALKAWRKLKPSDHNAAIAALPAYDFDLSQSMKFVPWPQKWLNERRWEDEPTDGSFDFDETRNLI